MNFITVLATIAGLIFLIQAILKEKNHRKVNAALFMICVVTAVFFYKTNKPEEPEAPPILVENKQQFQSVILTTTTKLRDNPVTYCLEAKKDLHHLIQTVKINPNYQKELPKETAMLYRLYGASIILAGQDPNVGPKAYLHDGFPFIQKSIGLYKSLWESKHDTSAFLLLSETFDKRNFVDFSDIQFIEKYLFAAFTAAMLLSTEDEVRNKSDPYIAAIKKTTKSDAVADLKYFYEYKNVESMLKAIQIMTVGMGGKFEGPKLLAQKDGNTLIRYVIIGEKGPVNVDWIVNAEKDLVIPNSEAAIVFHQKAVK